MLLAHLKEKEITLLTGPRQVGKTYLMRLVQEDLKKRGKPTLYLNLDVEEDKQFFTSQSRLLQRVKLEVGEKKAYIFIDEIQRKKNAGLFLKGIYDMDLPYKLIVSGSGSLELKEKIHESLAGRKRIFSIDPITFTEFVNYRTEYRYEERLQDFFDLEKDVTQRLLEEYIVFGGYPRVILADTSDKKDAEMEDIYESYVDKDVRKLLAVEKPDAFTNLLKAIASQIGSLVNITELTSTIGVADKTIQSYLWYLEKTFILHKVTPYYSNVRKEITKAPLYYFYDQGLRNYLLGLFGLPSLPPVLSGHLFENVVFNMLRHSISPPTSIHFWRTRDNAEVDFVLQTGLNVVPVEVKYSKLEKPELSRSFKSFLAAYKPSHAYLIHLGGKMETKIESTVVRFLPYYALQQEF